MARQLTVTVKLASTLSPKPKDASPHWPSRLCRNSAVEIEAGAGLLGIEDRDRGHTQAGQHHEQEDRGDEADTGAAAARGKLGKGLHGVLSTWTW
jgi:hypothetical protein